MPKRIQQYQQLTKGQRYQIEALYENGFSQRRIANSTGVHPGTTSRKLKRNRACMKYCAKAANILKDMKHRNLAIAAWFEQHQHHLTQKITLYQRNWDIIKKAISQPIRESCAVVEPRYKPGVQMQVDWAQMQGGRSPIYAFLATLGFSGFIPKLCWPYRAKTKGKVERMVRYLRYSFYLPLMTHLQQQHSVIDCDTANREVKKWLYKVANQRLHQTNLECPCDRWQHIEQPLLLPLPSYSPLLTPAQPLERLPLDSQPLHHPLAIYDCFCREVLMKLQPQRLQQLAEPLQLDSLGR